MWYAVPMKTVKVIPLSSAVQKEYLTYFTSKEVEVGMIVSVSIRKKNIDALVIEIGELQDEKSAVKNATFNLKKIEKIKGPSIFSPSFFKATEDASRYYIGTIGSVLDTLIPENILKNYEKLHISKKESVKVDSNLVQEKLVFQGSNEDRISFYKTFIRESFARKQSVYICLPTIQEIEMLAENLMRGIEAYTYTFHSEFQGKAFVEKYNSCIDNDHPVLILGTGSFLFIPRTDIETIIVEHESSTAYRTHLRPYLDIRTFVEFYSHNQKIKLLYGDTLLRPETIYRKDQGEFGEVAPISFRIPSPVTEKIVSTTVADPTDTLAKKKKVKFRVLSDEVVSAINSAHNRDEHVFLFTLRKGLAPITICHDCGNTVICDFCSSPLVLYLGETKQDRIYICNKCKREKTSSLTCTKCKSWNLVPLGIGTETVIEEFKELLPNAPYFQFDKDTIKNAKEAKKVIAEFYKTPGAVLIGTELALFYLTEKIATTAIISFDSLFSIPSFRINEKILHLVTMLRAITERELIIQTKNTHERILETLTTGNVLSFYREEIADRKMFGYPPFTVLFKISFQGNEAQVEKQKEFMKEYFAQYNPDVLDAFIKRIRGYYITHAIIKIPREQWILPGISKHGTFDTNLEKILRGLPQSFKVQIDPEDLL